MKDKILHKFHECFIQFIDELIEQFPQEAKLHIVRILVKDTTPPWKLMDKYVTFILPHKDLVDERDESFFLNQNEGFNQLADKNLISLQHLWKSQQVDQEDKEMIWKWFDLFNTLANKFVELN